MTITEHGRQFELLEGPDFALLGTAGLSRALLAAQHFATVSGRIEVGGLTYDRLGFPTGTRPAAVYINVRLISPRAEAEYIGRCPVHGIVAITGAHLKAEAFTCPDCWAELADVRD